MRNEKRDVFENKINFWIIFLSYFHTNKISLSKVLFQNSFWTITLSAFARFRLLEKLVKCGVGTGPGGGGEGARGGGLKWWDVRMETWIKKKNP